MHERIDVVALVVRTGLVITEQLPPEPPVVSLALDASLEVGRDEPVQSIGQSCAGDLIVGVDGNPKLVQLGAFNRRVVDHPSEAERNAHDACSFEHHLRVDPEVVVVLRDVKHNPHGGGQQRPVAQEKLARTLHILDCQEIVEVVYPDVTRPEQPQHVAFIPIFVFNQCRVIDCLVRHHELHLGLQCVTVVLCIYRNVIMCVLMLSTS